MAQYLPVVDFAPYNINLSRQDIDETLTREVDLALYKALSTVGFVYLTNHGLKSEQLQKTVDVSQQFFALPKEVKQQYSRTGETNHGWVCLEKERLNPDAPGDLKEAFNFTYSEETLQVKPWPDEVPNFRSAVEDFRALCERLSLRILSAICRGLQLKDERFFESNHRFRDVPNATTLRLLYYPPIDREVKPGQIRCGEHTDYGSITLLFQDDAGGLEVMNRDGDWVAAKPVQDAVLVNIGDLMQRWTADKLVSTKHRVVIPDAEIRRSKARMSLAFFVHPDDAYVIECLDGSNKYDAITNLDYINMRFADTY